MDVFIEIAPGIIIILGTLNLVAVTLIFSTCRCIPGLKIASKLTQHATYKRFFRYHCYIWWVLWPSVVIHAIVAITFIRFPY